MIEVRRSFRDLVSVFGSIVAVLRGWLVRWPSSPQVLKTAQFRAEHNI